MEQLTHEQRKQAAAAKKEREEAEVKQLFPQVVKQVAAAMGYTPRFHYKTQSGGKGEPFQRCYAVIESGARVITISTSDYSPDFRLSISGDYDMGPSELQVGWPYGLSRPSITVSMRRDAAAIAKEITNRFLPDYDAACAKIAERVKQATDYRDALHSTIYRLAAVAGVEVRKLNNGEPSNEFHKYYGANYTGPRLEVGCSNDGATVKIDCGVELAAAVIKAIETLATITNPNNHSIRFALFRDDDTNPSDPAEENRRITAFGHSPIKAE
jgi:hypothetical protein